MASAALWESSDASEWRAALAKYAERVEALASPDLKLLEGWFFRSLQPAITAAERAELTHEQFVLIVKWKLAKEKWRPRLVKMAEALEEEQVQSVTSTAFAQARDGQLSAAVATLCTLKGTGPATASLLLSVCCEEMPFMADAVLKACGMRPKRYTPAVLLKFAETLGSKAEELNEVETGEEEREEEEKEEEKKDEEEGEKKEEEEDIEEEIELIPSPHQPKQAKWTAQSVGWALWSQAATSMRVRKRQQSTITLPSQPARKRRKHSD